MPLASPRDDEGLQWYRDAHRFNAVLDQHIAATAAGNMNEAERIMMIDTALQDEFEEAERADFGEWSRWFSISERMRRHSPENAPRSRRHEQPADDEELAQDPPHAPVQDAPQREVEEEPVEVTEHRLPAPAAEEPMEVTEHQLPAPAAEEPMEVTEHRLPAPAAEEPMEVTEHRLPAPAVEEPMEVTEHRLPAPTAEERPTRVVAKKGTPQPRRRALRSRLNPSKRAAQVKRTMNARAK